MYLSDSDKRFAEYQKILKKITYTPHNSRLIVNILKAMIIEEEFTQSKIDTLFDICAKEFSDDPHFNLHYATNLQYRGTQIYSFLEYLRFEIWYLETFSLTQETELRSIISIENLLDRAKRQLHEGIEIIAEIEAKYRKKHQSSSANDKKHINFMSDLYKKEDLKPYALILYFYYYSQKNNEKNLGATVHELEEYAHLDEVLLC